jgi:predicted dehydrogenase
MTVRTVGIAMNGVTGRMGYRQHLVRSVLAIRDQGGIRGPDGTVLLPEPLLVGRNPDKLAEIARRHGLIRWTTDLDAALSDADVPVYFDAQLTSARAAALRRAIAAGKHVYTEKPVAEDVAEAVELARLAHEAGVAAGVVADKLYLPGIRKLRRLLDGDFFGRVLSVRGEFGYWVFEGDWQPAQRPSWNYRAEHGGGIVLDMFPHWNYLLEGLIGPVRAVTARAVTHVPRRWDEHGRPYPATADDAAYAIFELDGGVIAQFNSSWCVRVHRDELLELQVDGVAGSAVAGLHHCVVQHRSATPMPVWNPDAPSTADLRAPWGPVPDNTTFDNGFKVQWEEFLRHVGTDRAARPPLRHDLLAGARGVQLARLALASSAEGRRVEIPELAVESP